MTPIARRSTDVLFAPDGWESDVTVMGVLVRADGVSTLVPVLQLLGRGYWDVFEDGPDRFASFVELPSTALHWETGELVEL